jgi:hypothetical protein
MRYMCRGVSSALRDWACLGLRSLACGAPVEPRLARQTLQQKLCIGMSVHSNSIRFRPSDLYFLIRKSRLSSAILTEKSSHSTQALLSPDCELLCNNADSEVQSERVVRISEDSKYWDQTCEEDCRMCVVESGKVTRVYRSKAIQETHINLTS